MSRRILIIDDQPEIRGLVRAALETQGFDVHEAADGASGLALAQRLSPHLILLDVMMPGLYDGLETCRRLKRDPALAAVPVVMLSALGDAAAQQRGLAAGATAYVSKPFSPSRFVRMVDALAPVPT